MMQSAQRSRTFQSTGVITDEVLARTWKIIVPAPRSVIEAALLAHEDAVWWNADIVLSGSEIAEDHPDDWLLEAWLPRRPARADLVAMTDLFGGILPAHRIEPVPEADWVTLSQRDLAPIRAGRFAVRTPERPTEHDPATIDFVIPASQAFGTGQHATTAGCLAMLTAMRARGVIARNAIDVGSGTGLLAFATLALWPGTLMTASDIDPVCAGVIADNADANGVTLGTRRGELLRVIAPGLDHPLLAARGPYDLIVANILAGPLIALAPAFASALVPGGNVLLAGLLATQEPAVRRAYRRVGLRLAARSVRGDWAILWLRRRRA